MAKRNVIRDPNIRKLRNSKAMAVGDILASNDKITVRNNGRVEHRIEIIDAKMSKENKNILPYLIVASVVMGTTTKGKQWKQRIHLINPVLVSDYEAGFIEVEYVGDQWWMQPFDSSTPCRTACNCPDAIFTTHWDNADVKSHIGKRIPYTRKTTTRPARQAGRPGMCKHQLALLDKLTSMGVIKL